MAARVLVSRRSMAGVAVAACVWAASARTQGQLTYDEFVKKPAAEQLSAFQALSPETKALIKRTHAERWLEANRGSLSAKQQETVREAIGFLTPELYSGVPSAEMRAREEAIRRRLECGLGRTRATEAFAFLPQPPRQSVRDVIDEWLAWFVDCVGR